MCHSERKGGGGKKNKKAAIDERLTALESSQFAPLACRSSSVRLPLVIGDLQPERKDLTAESSIPLKRRNLRVEAAQERGGRRIRHKEVSRLAFFLSSFFLLHLLHSLSFHLLGCWSCWLLLFQTWTWAGPFVFDFNVQHTHRAVVQRRRPRRFHLLPFTRSHTLTRSLFALSLSLALSSLSHSHSLSRFWSRLSLSLSRAPLLSSIFLFFVILQFLSLFLLFSSLLVFQKKKKEKKKRSTVKHFILEILEQSYFQI